MLLNVKLYITFTKIPKSATTYFILQRKENKNFTQVFYFSLKTFKKHILCFYSNRRVIKKKYAKKNFLLVYLFKFFPLFIKSYQLKLFMMKAWIKHKNTFYCVIQTIYVCMKCCVIQLA